MTRAPQSHDCRLVQFYAGEQPDDRGRFLNDIHNWSDNRLEAVHDYIQWLFPLLEPSAFQPQAPVLDAVTIAAFRARPELQHNLRTSFLRLLRFYGLEWEAGRVVPAAQFEARAANWLSPSNHNHLRITRILLSLRLLGLEAEAQAFYTFLAALYRREPGRITAVSFRFWTSAAQDPLPPGD
jgi:hypothetical protein